MIDEEVHCGQCEYLAVRRLKKTAHVLAAELETAPGDAGDHIVVLAFGIPQRAQALNAGALSRAVPSSSASFASIRATGVNSSGTMKSGT